MKKLILLFLFLVLTSPLSAAKYKDRGFYGSLSFLYSEDESTTSDTTRSVQTFTNKFDLGYVGNIYSPRLLQYEVTGSVRSDKQTNETSTQKNTSNDYGIDLKFIQRTQYPFRIYANQQNSPSSIQYNDYSTSYTHETQAQGISGSINSTIGKFTYGASNYSATSEYEDKLQNIKTNNYNGSYNYNNQTHNVFIKFSHMVEENVIHDLNSSVEIRDNIKDVVSLSYKANISKDLKLNSDVSYETDGYYMTTETDVHADLQWKPQEANYDASLSMTAIKFEYEESNTTNVLNSYNIGQTLNYRFKSGINLAQNAQVYVYDASTVKGTNTNLSLSASHAYARDIFDDAKLRLTSRLMVLKNDSTTTKVEVDNSTTSSSDAVERYIVGVSADITKDLPSIESTFRMNSSVNMTTSSEDRQEQRYDFGLGLTSKLFYIVNNNLSANYSVANYTYAEGSSSYSSTNLRDTLNFNFRLGSRGRMAFNFGLDYSSKTTDKTSTSTLSPSAAANLNYRFFRRLKFSSGIGVKKYYDTLQYLGNMNLIYTAGLTSVSMDYQYNKSETQASAAIAEKIVNERTSLKIKFVRKF